MFLSKAPKALFLGLFVLSATAAAEDFNYNFVQATYGQIDFDEFGLDGDGFGIGGSVALSDSFHLFGAYTTADMDLGIDLNQIELGLGYNAPISETVDVVASLAYVSSELEAGGFSVDDDGYGLGVGLRAMLTPSFEVDGGISYVDMGDGGDDVGFGAGFLYHFTEQFSAGASAGWGDDVNTYSLNARMFFGK